MSMAPGSWPATTPLKVFNTTQQQDIDMVHYPYCFAYEPEKILLNLLIERKVDKEWQLNCSCLSMYVGLAYLLISRPSY